MDCSSGDVDQGRSVLVSEEQWLWIVEAYGRALSPSAVKRWEELPLSTDFDVQRAWSLRSVHEAGGITVTGRLAVQATSEADACQRAERFLVAATKPDVHVTGMAAEQAPTGWRQQAPAQLKPVALVGARADGERDVIFGWEKIGDVARIAVDETDDEVRIRAWDGPGSRAPDIAEGFATMGWPPMLIRVRLREPVGARRLIDGHSGVPVRRPSWADEDPDGPFGPRPASRHDLLTH